jgi:hypothetical protein
VFQYEKRFVSKMLTPIKKLCSLVFILWITIFPLAILVQLSVPKTSFVRVWRHRNFSDSLELMDSVRTRSVTAFYDTNRASERYVVTRGKSIRRRNCSFLFRLSSWNAQEPDVILFCQTIVGTTPS